MQGGLHRPWVSEGEGCDRWVVVGANLSLECLGVRATVSSVRVTVSVHARVSVRVSASVGVSVSASGRVRVRLKVRVRGTVCARGVVELPCSDG